MSRGAQTPEELEALLEDAFLTHDREALSEMFTEGAVVALGTGPYAARGADEIGRLVTALWESGRTYLAEPRQVLQARDVALVVADQAINVVRRGREGTWRYAILFQSLDPRPAKEEP